MNSLKKIDNNMSSVQKIDGEKSPLASSGFQKFIQKHKEKIRPYYTKTLNAIDMFVAVAGKGNASLDNPVIQATRGSLRFGLWVIVFVFGFFGVWAATAPIDSASVAQGTVVVGSHKKTIQHFEGGIVSQILVKEGDSVEKGQPLVILNDTRAKTTAEALQAQLRMARATESRIIAERDGAEIITWHPSLIGERLEEEVEKAKNTQEGIFITRQKAYSGKINVYYQKIVGSKQEIEGLTSQLKATSEQVILLKEEEDVLQRLKGIGAQNRERMLRTQRERTEAEGRRGAFVSQIARIKQAITETELEILNIRNDLLRDAAKEMHDTQANIAELEERLRAATDVLERIVVSAPQSGVISGLNVHTVGGVVAPGATLMEIVPQGEELIVEAKLRPQDIDVVHSGLVARVKLDAYKSRTAPMITGLVEYVSADRFVDERMPQDPGYYKVRVVVDKEALEKLKNVELYPGMPASVFIVTGERTLLEYLLSPITQSIQKSFRED